MGRKKRKTLVDEDSAGGGNVDSGGGSDPTIGANEESMGDVVAVKEEIVTESNSVVDAVVDPLKSSIAESSENKDIKQSETMPKSSKYAITSHSGEIIREDHYVSDGSEDDSEDVDVVLSGSRSGLMKRGLATPLSMIQPNRQWIRPGDPEDEDAEKQRQEELERLDPVQRAARLQAEKQRLEQQEKEEERIRESQENAGRDPNLFSKRTAFDIRFDQMEDKPWLRGGDLSDFFNYGLDEEGWLEYAQQQLSIRQELTDAARNKRLPDPNIIPVAPKTPSSQAPRVAVVGTRTTKTDGMITTMDEIVTPEPVMADAATTTTTTADFGLSWGPSLPQEGILPKTLVATQETVDTKPSSEEAYPVGGAWGALPGSHLAKLLEEQQHEQQQQQQQQHLMRETETPFGNNDNNTMDYSGQNNEAFAQEEEEEEVAVGGTENYGGEGNYYYYGSSESNNNYYGSTSDGHMYGSMEVGNDNNNNESFVVDDTTNMEGHYSRPRGRGRGGGGRDYWGEQQPQQQQQQHDKDDSYYSRKRNREWRR